MVSMKIRSAPASTLMLPAAPDDTQQYTPENAHFGVKEGPYSNAELDATTPQQDAQAIQQAAQSGQKEVFDVSMLKQLITNVNTSDHVDSMVSQLVRGMDKVARLLFLVAVTFTSEMLFATFIVYSSVTGSNSTSSLNGNVSSPDLTTKSLNELSVE